MCRPFTWQTQIEIEAVACLFQVSVYNPRMVKHTTGKYIIPGHSHVFRVCIVMLYTNCANLSQIARLSTNQMRISLFARLSCAKSEIQI